MDALDAWNEFHREASSLVSQMTGWGEGVDLEDDAQLLSWARHYLPQVLELSDRAPK